MEKGPKYGFLMVHLDTYGGRLTAAAELRRNQVPVHRKGTVPFYNLLQLTTILISDDRQSCLRKDSSVSSSRLLGRRAPLLSAT